MGESSSVAMRGGMRLLVPRRILMAGPARWPRIMSTTSRTFCGDVRTYLASALANILSSSLRSGDGCGWWVVGKTYTHTPHPKTYDGFAVFSVVGAAAAFTECPLNWRFCRNTPHLPPTLVPCSTHPQNFPPVLTSRT